MEKELINNHIADLRKKLGLSQEEFGKPLGKIRSDISRYEKGMHLTIRILMEIRKVYGVSLDEIIYGEEGIKISKEEFEVLQKFLKDVFAKSNQTGKLNA